MYTGSMPTRRAVLQSLAGAAVGRLLSGAPRERKTNFVILLSDDLGYGDVGCFGSPDVPTQYIDSIASGGVRFTDGYVTCPVCSPSRSAVMTGRYQQRYGHEFNPDNRKVPHDRDVRENLGLPLSEITLAQLLKKAGYATGAVGKWHLGSNPPFHPMSRGFDEYFGFLPGGNAYVTDKTPGAVSVAALDTPAYKPIPRIVPVMRGREPVEENEYRTDALGREAVSFIERHKSEPFFLYLAFNAIHVPLQVTAHYLDRFANIANERHRALAAMTYALDQNIGRVLAMLRETGLEKDTVVFFFSDNGCPTYSGSGTNGPLSGGKCTLFEGGIRIPFCMQWPGHVPPGQTYHHPMMSFDLLATFHQPCRGGVSQGSPLRWRQPDPVPDRQDNQTAPREAVLARRPQLRDAPGKLEAAAVRRRPHPPVRPRHRYRRKEGSLCVTCGLGKADAFGAQRLERPDGRPAVAASSEPRYRGERRKGYVGRLIRSSD